MKHAVSLLIQDPLGKFLLIQRGEASSHFQNQWEFPGGKLDAGETMQAALQREVQEEIGVHLNLVDAQPVERIQIAEANLEYAFFVWQCSRPLPDVRLSPEHKALRWATWTEARELPIVAVHREFLEHYWLREQVAAYEKERHRYEEYATTLEAVLNQLKDRWAPLALVQARPKSLSSFAEKCLRKAEKHSDPVHQLTDLCGGRIITTTTKEAKTICSQLRGLFHPVDEEDDTRTRHGVSAFGYLSVHFVVHFPEGMKEMLGVKVPAEVTGLKAEIQVRTLLQHAHSEVTHDRLYKAGYTAPKHCEREAARVAAALEMSDDEFTRFVNQLDAYVGSYASHLEPEKRQRRIADLKLVLRNETKPASQAMLALRVARLSRAAWDWQAVVDDLTPFQNEPWLGQDCVRMELGNAFCRLHRDSPNGEAFQHGLQLLASVADPHGDADRPMEDDERINRATALAWLGSALSKIAGKRNDARDCLAKAVKLEPLDPYYFVAFVELDIIATGTDEHVALLSAALRQAVARCQEHVSARIEVVRAWLTLAKIRLLLSDDTGAVEAVCLAARIAETHHPLLDFHASLERLKDAVGGLRPFVETLHQVTLLLAKAKEFKTATKKPGVEWRPFEQKLTYPPTAHFLILAGATSSLADTLLEPWERPLCEALASFDGYILSGGTDAGVCKLAGHLSQELHAARRHKVNLVGYLPEKAAANPNYAQLVRTPGTRTFSILEPVQMWADLLLGGVKVDPHKVTLLALGGGEITSQELALAWALGARTAALADESHAARRFKHLLDSAGDNVAHGLLLPADAATVAMFFKVKAPKDDPEWEQEWEPAGQAVHEDYVKQQQKSAKQKNLLPWEVLRDDFKHSNRHQAACAVDILRRHGFIVEKTSLPPQQIPLLQFAEAEIKPMAEMEHGRWNVERLGNGWRFGERKDEDRKLSPSLIPWHVLPENIRAYDFNSVRAWPKILAQGGLVVKRPVSKSGTTPRPKDSAHPKRAPKKRIAQDRK